MKVLVLFNPLSQKGKGKSAAESLRPLFKDDEVTFKDITETDIASCFAMTPDDVRIIFTGGDGTLNRMLNELDKMENPREVYYFPAGTGNDFVNDIGKTTDTEPFPINEYLKGLPTVQVNGITCKYVNNVSFGLDGFCCEESDRLKALGKDKSYSSIAISGLLGKYKPTNAKVTVDGVTKEYKKVFMAPTMFGKFCGGGIQVAPKQDRKNPEHSVTSIVIHNIARLHALLLFPNIIAGKGGQYPKYIEYRTGRDVTVEFDRPTALQIDGETVLGVTKYEVHAARP